MKNVSFSATNAHYEVKHFTDACNLALKFLMLKWLLQPRVRAF